MKYSEFYSEEFLSHFEDKADSVGKLSLDIDSPSINVDKIISLFDIEIREEYEGDFSGVIRPLDDGKYEIVVNPFDSEQRKRFTKAHELGHFLLEDVDEDFHRQTVNLNGYSETKRKSETKANFFAAQLIMPAQLIIKLIKNWVEAEHNGDFDFSDADLEQMITWLSKSLDVSYSAMKVKLNSLGIIYD
ncbi:ImmA/IrrE family metallo-endopeptidase [Leuconostoc mesenteroides]|uniref:ImmA/IrrE family metallo-endopeptidase n=1 Tax=Leuconostoc mesenteroides TaxID=1245 RepID=UPI001FBA5A40|nr:ImmA/IrrE family metallo-endopeptidase [Leuconostoc mesenteroides]MCJ2158600.1 ImmA/IrrE family metallo-endopeptidase [Leuconostoc mesenteroides]MCM6835975.1 ImmA/IrrE family metallo-endopeptidase [Leuconostoc mesenteroides]